MFSCPVKKSRVQIKMQRPSSLSLLNSLRGTVALKTKLQSLNCSLTQGQDKIRCCVEHGRWVLPWIYLIGKRSGEGLACEVMRSRSGLSCIFQSLQSPQRSGLLIIEMMSNVSFLFSFFFIVSAFMYDITGCAQNNGGKNNYSGYEWAYLCLGCIIPTKT